MRTFFVLFAHLLVAIAQLMKSGGARAIVAENLLLKQQLLVACRTRQRAPRLSMLDRLLFGLWSLFLSTRRLVQAAIILKPYTLLRFHAALWLPQASSPPDPGSDSGSEPSGKDWKVRKAQSVHPCVQ